MPRKASSTSDSRLKWRKRKRNADASPSKPSTSAAAAVADHSSDSDSADEDAAVHGAVGDRAAGDDDDAPAASEDPALALREAEVLPSAEAISAFPAAKRRVVNRPHPSVLALLKAERSASSGDVPTVAPPTLENISHGQLQVLSGVLPDHPSLETAPAPLLPPALAPARASPAPARAAAATRAARRRRRKRGGGGEEERRKEEEKEEEEGGRRSNGAFALARSCSGATATPLGHGVAPQQRRPASSHLGRGSAVLQ
ncbi:SWI/SNF complex subunit SWI3C homolog [Miscanthus floridulus]|uniref:SWI/SNF complex subunit SWI3C homolog n=1 Tax=Miscanthus floridulus TaxID=154761 RepID=UPI003459462D